MPIPERVPPQSPEQRLLRRIARLEEEVRALRTKVGLAVLIADSGEVQADAQPGSLALNTTTGSLYVKAEDDKWNVYARDLQITGS